MDSKVPATVHTSATSSITSKHTASHYIINVVGGITMARRGKEVSLLVLVGILETPCLPFFAGTT